MQSNMVSNIDPGTKRLEAEFEEVGTVELEDGGNREDYQKRAHKIEARAKEGGEGHIEEQY